MNWTARDDQIEDLAHLMRNPRDLVLHDPGVGKTITAALWAAYAWRAKKIRTALVQPLTLMKKNKEEFEKFSGLDPSEIVLVSGQTPKKRLEAMQSDAKVFLFGGDNFATEWETLRDIHRDLGNVILDEPHLYFSGHKSKRTQSFYRASRKMWSVVPMTGSIIKGKLDSIYPFLHASFPQYYGSYEQFMVTHAETDEYGSLIHWKNHEHLRKILEKHSICRSFASVYGEDATVIQVETCDMHAAQREKYDELEAFALMELEDRFIEAGSPGVKAIRARQVMAHPVELGVVPVGTVTGKDEAIMLHVKEALFNEERLVIFAALIPEQERIVAMIEKLGGKVGLINGNVAMSKRGEIDYDFRAGRLQFIVGSPACTAVGFNWGFLRKVVFASIDYQDDNFVQAYKRGVRGVREHPLLVIVLEYRKSLDQRIFQIVDRKSRDSQLITPHKKALHLTGKALRELMPEEGPLSMETI